MRVAVAIALVGCRFHFDGTGDATDSLASEMAVDMAMITCPTNYTMSVTGCHRYETMTRTAQASQAACAADGGHLAIITSTAENQTLTAVITSSAWLGYVDLGAGFVAITTGTTPSFTNWAPGDPNGEGTCARMLPGGDWDDEACSLPKSSVCEIDGVMATTAVP